MAERDLVVRIIGDDKSLRRTLGRSEKDLGTFSAKVSSSAGSLGKWAKAGGLAAAGIGAAIGVGIVKSVGAASDLNEEISKSNVLFGKSAGAVQAWSKTTASSIGIARSDALAAAGNFGAMFSTIGVGDKTSAQMSTRLVKLGADLASFSNQDPGEMLDKLRSGLAGEAEPLRRFGILLSEQRVKQEAVRLGLAKQGAELTEQQKVAARYSLILRDAGKANGDFARTSDSLANEQRVAKAEIKDLSAQIGGAFLPVAAKALGIVNRLIPVLGQGATAISAKLGPAFSQVFSTIAAKLPEIERVGRAIIEPIQRNVLPVLRDIGGIVATTFANVASVVAANSDSIRTSLSNVGTILRAVWTIARPTIVFLFTKVLPVAVKITIKWFEKMTGVVKIVAQVFARVVSIIIKALDKLLGAASFVGNALNAVLPGNPFGGATKSVDNAREHLRNFASDLDAINGKTVTVGVNVKVKGTAGSVNRSAAVPGKGKKAGDAAAASIGEATAADIAVGGSLDANTKATKVTKTKAEKARDAFDALMETLSLRFDKAEFRGAYKDQLSILTEEENAVKKQIAVEGHTAELERQLFDIRRQRLELRQTHRQQQQFLALGLTGEGEKRTASAKAILRRVASLRERIKGTPLDTAKTRQQLAQITKVLKGAYGKAGKEVRDAILGMLDEIGGALKSKTPAGGGGTGELTRGGIRSGKKLVAGLGLTPEQERIIRQRNARVTRRRGRVSAFGFVVGGGTGGGIPTVRDRGVDSGSRARQIVINGPITVVSNDPDTFMRQLQKKSARTAGSRRGRHGGVRLGLG